MADDKIITLLMDINKRLGTIEGELKLLPQYYDRMNRIDKEIETIRKDIDHIDEKLSKRIGTNEKKLWTIAGIMTAVGSIFTLVIRYLMKGS